MVPKLEDALVRELAAQLLPKAKRVWTNKKPSTSPKFRTHIEEKLGYVPILQPEIDLCLLSQKNQLVAVEAKLFRGSELTYKTPFYEGIGQALALHRYGFDAAALWFLFPEGVNTTGMNRYGAEAWSYIRNDLQLPLDFSYLAVERVGSKNKFNVMQYTGRQQGFKIGVPIDHPRFRLSWKYPNPIRCYPVQQALREAIEWYLGV
jgi:hypothetical protein